MKIGNENPVALFVLAAFAVAVAGCDRVAEAPVADRAPVSSATPVPSPSVPDAAAATRSPADATAGSAAGTANADDSPMKAMSKSEERTAMPMPGQANDHSTLSSEPKKP